MGRAHIRIVGQVGKAVLGHHHGDRRSQADEGMGAQTGALQTDLTLETDAKAQHQGQPKPQHEVDVVTHVSASTHLGRGEGSALSHDRWVSLARALVRRPDVLILDETTAALDAAARDLVLAASVRHSCATIVIAHI